VYIHYRVGTVTVLDIDGETFEHFVKETRFLTSQEVLVNGDAQGEDLQLCIELRFSANTFIQCKSIRYIDRYTQQHC
jgi:hypothetical protein